MVGGKHWIVPGGGWGVNNSGGGGEHWIVPGGGWGVNNSGGGG